jgi:hypothetical protein
VTVFNSFCVFKDLSLKSSSDKMKLLLNLSYNNFRSKELLFFTSPVNNFLKLLLYLYVLQSKFTVEFKILLLSLLNFL